MDSHTTLKSESLVRLPSVDEAINLGYAMHVADDKDLRESKTQQVARRRLDLFMEVETPVGSPERAYYECVMDIATSLGRGITRAKEQYKKDLDIAKEKQAARREQIKDARKSGDWLNIVFRMLKPLLMFLGGLLVAQLISLFTPIGVMVKSAGAENSQPVVVVVINIVASTFLGLSFVLIARSISFYVMDFKRSRVDNDYRSECHLAYITYERSKQAQFKLFRGQLCQAWKFYTGQDYPETVSYEAVAEGDLAARQRMEFQMNRSSMGDMLTITRFLRRFGLRPKSRTECAA